MKDLTSTSFGYVIAFLLPGLLGLYALNYWSSGVKELLQPALKADATVGPSLILLLIALGIGLIISALRFFVFEKLLCKKHRFQRNMFAKLVEEDKLTSFRAVVDEHYRYHQFYGGCGISIIALYSGWLLHGGASGCSKLWVSLGFLSLELILIFTAKDAFVRYIERGNVTVNGEHAPTG